MAFGISRRELNEWKQKVSRGQIAFLTHYWIHPRFPEMKTVTKAGCADVDRLIRWGNLYGLSKDWIHDREHYPHFDLIGERQRMILEKEGLLSHIARFKMDE